MQYAMLPVRKGVSRSVTLVKAASACHAEGPVTARWLLQSGMPRAGIDSIRTTLRQQPFSLLTPPAATVYRVVFLSSFPMTSSPATVTRPESTRRTSSKLVDSLALLSEELGKVGMASALIHRKAVIQYSDPSPVFPPDIRCMLHSRYAIHAYMLL